MRRRLRLNAYGNWVGYISGKRVEEFGTDEVEAFYWLRTGINDWNAAYEPEEFERTRQQKADPEFWKTIL